MKTLKLLFFILLFSGKIYSQTYCTSISQQSNNLTITNVTLGALNNTSDCNSTGGPGSVIRQYSDYTTTVAAPTLAKLNEYPFSINVGTCQYFGAHSTGIWIDFNHDGIFDSPTERVYTDPAFNYNPNYTISGTIIIPATALTGVTRMRVVTAILGAEPCGVYNGGETEDYNVNIVPTIPCTGTPMPGNAIASQNPVCPSANFILSLSNSLGANASGYTFQWYNNAGAIVGATKETYVATTTNPDNFYCVVTCTHTSQTATSMPIAVGVKLYLTCYCDSYAQGVEYADIFNVTAGTLNNSSNFSQTGGPGSLINRYSDYTTVVAAADFNQLATYPLSVHIGPNTFYSATTVWIDYNHNSIFEAPNELLLRNADLNFGEYTAIGSFKVPITALTGLTRMRVITNYGTTPVSSGCGAYNLGETEDYLVNITPPPACSGSPIQTAAIATQNPICPDVNFTFSLNPKIITANNTFQWYNNSGAIAGATDETYTANITAADNFYCIVTCTNGGNTTTSAPIAMADPYLYCSCGSGSNIVNDEDIFNVTVGSLNNSSNCGLTGGPGSVKNKYSDYSSLVAAPQLVKLGTTPFSVAMSTCNSYALTAASIWIDYNHDGNFEAPSERVYNSGDFFNLSFTATGSFVVPATALIGLTRMRVILARWASNPMPSACGGYDGGETEDYFVNITAPDCAGLVTLPTAATTKTQNVSSVNLVSNNCEYVAKVVPITGFSTATVKSWLETTPPFIYVPRHYEITPSTNQNTATGTVTLYFSQADFNAYNGTVTTGLLPTGPTDNAGIANFQILKYAGTSPTGLGYTGSPTLIPGSGNAWNTGAYTFVWNSTNSIWEVTFPVTGFSGFLAKSTAQPLPVNLISFVGKATEKGNELSWKTNLETNFSHFEIQRSSPLTPGGGIVSGKFVKIGQLNSDESGKYEYLDSTPPLGAGGLYRLKMVDLDGSFTYSKIIYLENNIEKSTIGNFYPLPAIGNEVSIHINSIKIVIWTITSYDLSGKIISSENRLLIKGDNQLILNINANLSKIIIYRFENDDEIQYRKLIK